MSTFSLADHQADQVPDASFTRFGIVVTEWNASITEALLKSALETLVQYGASENSVTIHRVPGSFELIYGCSQLAAQGYFDAIIAIGCVIKGDTPHFDYICQGTTQGLAQLNATGRIPVVNGVLTVLDEEQAQERAGKKMDKGREFALTAIKMAQFKKSFEQ